MLKNFPKTYEAELYEDEIYKKWEADGYFNPDKKGFTIKQDLYQIDKNLKKNFEKIKSYTIVMPPPNVTGTLHLGHAAMLALEDILIRYHRMKGKKALWIPGTDHAAIATQTKVEKIIKEEGTNRHKMGKEKFLERVKLFAQESHDTIANQARKMGSSCDWSREAYTLDDTRNKAVRCVFKMMYDDGLIYRGERIVNWCPRCHSTLADDEVEYKAQKAKLYYFKYDKNFPITIATTRPETKLGDTAVAVNPKDERYKKFIGQYFEVDFCGIKLKIKIIADRHIDMNFGTGALGVTPAHSQVDWKMAEENDLEIVKVIDEDGKIHQNFGEFSGLDVYKIRKLIVEKLKKLDLIEKTEEIDNNLSICYRCDTPIEPLPSLQWFIDVNKKIEKRGNKSIKELSIQAVEKGVFGREKINIVPKRFEKNYYHWMRNLNDWCISRQILFGHRVPVWYRDSEVFVGIDAPEGDGWVRDEDTLDTWFSSGLWTFSTLVSSPEQIKIENGNLIIDSKDFRDFHPTQVLETGYDILFFWVARMIIMTTYAVGDIPFQDVYLHGLVLDEKGKKMSKSKGNSVDPLEMISKYGTDAVRLALVIGSSPGNDIKMSEEKIAGNRNLVNKIWNISRFVNEKISDLDKKLFNDKIKDLSKKDLNNWKGEYSVVDIWILKKFEKLIHEVSFDLDNYRFSQAGEKLREFTWNDFADWYLEASKFETKNKEEKLTILWFIFKNLIRMWHPFTPFVTEVINRELMKTLTGEDISEHFNMITAPWPDFCFEMNNIDTENNKDDFELIKNIIIAIRNARAENEVEPSRQVKAIINTKKHKKLIESQIDLIKKMRTGISELIISKENDKEQKDAIHLAVGDIGIYLIGAIDYEKEAQRKQKQKENLEKLISNTENKLANQDFVNKAPAKIVEREKENLKKWQEELEAIN